MSWRKIFLFPAVILSLSSCGFEPLYAIHPASNEVATVDELRYVDIPQIENRIGQQLRNALIATLPPQSATSKYKLMVQLTENIDDFNIRRDTTATFARLTVTANFTLYTLDKPEKVLLQGASRAGNSYNILASTYATVTAEEDARERATRQLAEDIKLRLASYFAAKGS